MPAEALECANLVCVGLHWVRVVNKTHTGRKEPSGISHTHGNGDFNTNHGAREEETKHGEWIGRQKHGE
jgi:hypothetical protein